jgi:enterochelin esterase-like enzyme
MMKKFRTIEISDANFEVGNLRYVTVKSDYLKGRGDCTFFVPSQLGRRAKNVPVVILLHGVYGSHWAWTYNINVHGIAERLIQRNSILPMVLVMPSDGLWGDGSGYFNHGSRDFENWIVKDVVQLIPEVLPKQIQCGKLFIGGLSMGGYGALRLMARHPGIFAGASGLSSITSLKDLLPFLARGEKRYFRDTFGSERLIDYMAKNRASLPPFRFDCGREDGLINSNRKLHEQLLRAGVSHNYEEFNGGHSNAYWNRHIGRTLIYFSNLAK